MAPRVLKTGGSLVTYIGQYARRQILNLVCENSNDSLVDWWELTVMHSGGQERMFQKQVIVDWKPLLWFVKGKKLATPYFIYDSIKSGPPDKTLHEWAQSTKEAEYIINFLTLEGQTVLDPFCGAGTTALAALNLNRRFIGIDINPEALEATRTNISLNLYVGNTNG